jgi:hypothetical protein
MAVILKTMMAGPDGVKQAGERAELSPQTERELVAGGYASYVAAPVRETAAIAPRETAAIPAARKRGR